MSLRILHTADWHLGKKLDHFSRLEEQKLVMAEICDIADAQNVDVVIVAGDLFDTFNPPAEAQDLFYKTLFRLTNNGKRAVVAIAGNHDMPERVEAPNPLAEMNGIIL
jgi:exonuclease SbcD